MPSILPPRDILEADPERLYKIGFAGETGGDVLQRAAIGKKLSNICENLTNPLTAALNGGWGSGKTWFLKRWVGAHGLENGGKALTVYLSAFSRDYLGDPLPSIILAIEERLSEQGTKSRKLFDKAKHIAGKLAVPAFKTIARAGAAAATAGVSEIAAAGINAAEESAEQAAKLYWQAEAGKCKAMEEFRAKMAEFAKEQPLIIVIDELDRAKPDYALAVLETIKHFFDADGVKFILGVNLSALAQIVKKRYGFETTEAEKYLERFINFSMSLPDTVQNGQINRKAALTYCEYAAQRTGLNKDLTVLLNKHLEAVTRNKAVSLRDTQRIFSKFMLIITAVGEESFLRLPAGITEICLALLSSEVIEPGLYKKFIDFTFTEGEILHYYDCKAEYEQLNEHYLNVIHNSHPRLQDGAALALNFIEYGKSGNHQGIKGAYSAFMWVKLRAFPDEDISFAAPSSGIEAKTASLPQQIARQFLDIFSLDIKPEAAPSAEGQD